MTIERLDCVEIESWNELDIGDEFEVAGVPFVVIGRTGDTVTIQQHRMIEYGVFDHDGCNKYRKSDIKEYLETTYEAKFPEDFISMMNGGHFFLLSEDDVTPGKTQYPYYENLENRTKYDCKGYVAWWWTSTPHVGIGNTVRLINPSGYVSYNYAYSSYGVAPACVLHLTS